FASGGSFTDSIDQAGRLAMLVATAPDAGLQNTRLALEPAGADLPFSSLLAAPKAKEDFAGTASGRRRGLAWRMFLLAPYAFERAALSTIDDRAKPGDAAAVYERLFLYYASPAR
ncbi:MAG TPA: hypothetical protein VGE52_19050, partial [Pirellulales bacterium]